MRQLFTVLLFRCGSLILNGRFLSELSCRNFGFNVKTCWAFYCTPRTLGPDEMASTSIDLLIIS